MLRNRHSRDVKLGTARSPSRSAALGEPKDGSQSGSERPAEIPPPPPPPVDESGGSSATERWSDAPCGGTGAGGRGSSASARPQARGLYISTVAASAPMRGTASSRHAASPRLTTALVADPEADGAKGPRGGEPVADDGLERAVLRGVGRPQQALAVVAELGRWVQVDAAEAARLVGRQHRVREGEPPLPLGLVPPQILEILVEGDAVARPRVVRCEYGAQPRASFLQGLKIDVEVRCAQRAENEIASAVLGGHGEVWLDERCVCHLSAAAALTRRSNGATDGRRCTAHAPRKKCVVIRYGSRAAAPLRRRRRRRVHRLIDGGQRPLRRRRRLRRRPRRRLRLRLERRELALQRRGLVDGLVDELLRRVEDDGLGADHLPLRDGLRPRRLAAAPCGRRRRRARRATSRAAFRSSTLALARRRRTSRPTGSAAYATAYTTSAG